MILLVIKLPLVSFENRRVFFSLSLFILSLFFFSSNVLKNRKTLFINVFISVTCINIH